MKPSDIMTIYTVAIDILAAALLLVADCFAHHLIAAGMGVMGLVTLTLLVNSETSKKS